MRIGQAVDIHPLVEDRALILGGVKIDFEKGLAGHSDADVLTHAVTEALIGALGLGDLGTHFPDTDPKYEGISSLLLLAEAGQMVRQHGFRVENIDATILAERPKLAPYIPKMRENIAAVLEIGVEQVNIKATRGEKLGFVGREEGMVSMAVCLLEKSGKITLL